MKKIGLYTLVVLLLCPFDLAASTPKLAKQITIDAGLSQSTVSSIYQAVDGRMWFATGDGISIYNGEEFEYIYRGDNSDSGLQSNYTRVIAESPDGKIWIGTLGGGISIFTPKGEFVSGFRSPDGFAHRDDVFDVAWTSESQAWVATGEGLIFIEVKENVQNKLSIISLPEPILQAEARAVLSLDSNRILIGTRSHGLIIFDSRTLKTKSFSSENSNLSGDRIIDIFQDSAGGIWIGTEDGGLNFMNPITYEVTQPLPLSDSDIESIAQGQDGRLWFGSWSNGIVLPLF